LAIEVLSQLLILGGIEEMIADIYKFFCKSPKKHLEFVKLAELLESKGNKILRNIKTRWLSMLAPAVRIMNEYRPLLVKLLKEAKVRRPKQLATTCFQHIMDVQVLLGLAYILPMLRLFNKLMKYAQRNDVFVCDYLASVQVLKNDLHRLYVDERTMFTHEIFWDFNMLVEVHADQIPMKWTIEEFDLNLEGVEFLTFEPRAEYSMRPYTRTRLQGLQSMLQRTSSLPLSMVLRHKLLVYSILYFWLFFSLPRVFYKHLMLIHI
jgi:hypothetical protein